MIRKPPVPKGAGPSGRKLWNSIVSGYELEEHESMLLRELVRIVDRLDQLHALLVDEGLIVSGGAIGLKPHPALVEARQLAIAQARLTVALRLPVGDESVKRPQRRGGVRGTYGARP
jgi:hypothetical protein